MLKTQENVEKSAKARECWHMAKRMLSRKIDEDVDELMRRCDS